MDTNYYHELTSKLITTKSDKAIIFDALSLLKDSAYMNNSSKFIEKIKASVPMRFFEALEILISKSATPKELSENAISLEEYLNQLPAVHLTIGYEPTKNQLEQLVKKINEKIIKQSILDYSVIPDFLGIKIEFGGKVYEKSVNIELES